MTIEITTTIRCDRCREPGRSVTADGLRRGAVRLDAHKAGWIRDGVKDFCLACAPVVSGAT